MNTHTPGPWHIGTRSSGRAIYGSKGEEVATFTGLSMPDEELANARLIAAAPELLDALKWAVQQIEDDLDPDHQTAMDACLAAIARAEGGEA